MIAVRLRLPAAAACAALLLAACVHERAKSIGYVKEGALAPPAPNDAALTASAWSDRAFGRRRARADDGPVRESPAAIPVAAAPASFDVPSGDRTLDRAVRVSEAPPAHRAIPAGESLEARAREKFLASATEVFAERATLYVPRAYEPEIVREGLTIVTLRRLTVRASQLTVVVRDGNPDIQLSARGGVSFRSDQPASILEESGLRSLLLKNDGYTPLP